jgi:hypothetical protein
VLLTHDVRSDDVERDTMLNNERGGKGDMHVSADWNTTLGVNPVNSETVSTIEFDSICSIPQFQPYHGHCELPGRV